MAPDSLSFQVNRDFPNEVLLQIFHFLYLDHLDSITSASSLARFEDGPHDYSISKEDLKSSYLFPRSQANVSNNWRDVLLSVPQFWTRVVIFLDTPGCVPFARRQIESSRSLPVSIVVTTMNADIYSDQPDLEQEICGKIIDLISPHISRCTSVTFDVTYSSSLPRLAVDFQDTAPYLEQLTLHSKVSRRLACFKDGRTPLRFPFPNLKTIDIDGWNIVDICTTNSEWIQQLIRGSHDLRISHYTPALEERVQDGFTINDIFPAMNLCRLPGSKPLCSLTLDNVDFNSTSARDIVCTVDYLQLSRLGGELTSDVLRHFTIRELSGVEITRCVISAVVELPPTDELSFIDIDDPGFSAQLSKILPEWEGRELIFKGCSTFDDDALRVLGSATIGRDGPFLNCSQLSHLTIIDCAGFSFAALRNMIGNRLEIIYEHPMQCEVSSFTLSVQGKIPVAKDQDRAWFKKTFRSGRISNDRIYLDWNHYEDGGGGDDGEDDEW